MPTLVRCAGLDGPGITAAVLGAVDAVGATLLEMDQLVVRGRLTLDLLVDAADPAVLGPALGAVAAELGVEVTLEPSPDGTTPPAAAAGGAVVTVMAERLGAAPLAAVTGAIATSGGNIARIQRLAHRPVCAFEFHVAGGDPSTLRSVLVDAAAAHGVDVAVQADRLGRLRRLVVLDVDSTLIRDEVIELVAAEVGCEDEVAAITARAMAGELDFEQSLRARVALLAGAPVGALDAAAARLRLTPGARTLVRTLHRLGLVVAVVSGGFDHVVVPLAQGLGIRHAAANRLEVVDGRLTGGLVGPVLDRAGKARELHRIAEAEGIPLEQTVAIGDGANDLDMIAAAGLGVAFNAKPAVRAAADTSVSVPRLDAVLFLLGVHSDEVVADPDDEPVAAVA